MALPMQEEEPAYNYADYLNWDDGKRWELIDGVAHMMSPAPTQAHQEVSGGLYRQFADFLDGKPCKVFHAPFDVRLNANDGDDTVVQPDLLVVCDKSKLDGKSCVGAPDLVVEILSPSTARHDRLTKFLKYQEAGVREYWIVDPDTKTVQLHILDEGGYMNPKSGIYSDEDVVSSHVLEGFSADMKKIFSARADEPTRMPTS